MRRVPGVPAVVCGIAALLTTGCASMAGLAVLHVAFDEGSVPQAADPDHPAAYRIAATTGWIDLLHQQGAATAEDSLRHPRADLQQRLLSRELDVLVRDQIARAVRLAEKRAVRIPISVITGTH